MAKTRIGLIADTHMPPWDEAIMRDVGAAFADVDLILHAGDIVTLEVLDWLETIAPVAAAIGNNDVHLPPDPRLKSLQQLECDGVSIGVFHIYEPWDMAPAELMKRYFSLDACPDVLVIGDTHFEVLEYRDGVLIVNPGSPTSSHLRVDQPGTVALLEVEGGRASARIQWLGLPRRGMASTGRFGQGN